MVARAAAPTHRPQPGVDGAAIEIGARRAARRRALTVLVAAVAVVAASAVLLTLLLTVR